MDADLLAKINEMPSQIIFQGLGASPNKLEDKTDVAIFKVIIIGNTGVGKSCILARLTQQVFRSEHNVTIGVEFGNFAMSLREKTNVKLQIWDTAG